MKRRRRKKHNRHGAAALTVVLVSISVIGALMLASMHTSLRQRRQLDIELQMEQTRWLAEAGLNHAEKLIKSGDELGSDPIVIQPKLDSNNTAEVKIEFTLEEGSVEVNVSAWIGLVDRPETQTRQTFDKTFKQPAPKTTSEETDSTSEE